MKIGTVLLNAIYKNEIAFIQQEAITDINAKITRAERQILSENNVDKLIELKQNLKSLYETRSEYCSGSFIEIDIDEMDYIKVRIEKALEQYYIKKRKEDAEKFIETLVTGVRNSNIQ